MSQKYMSQKNIHNNTFIPMPMSIVGTRLNCKENFMAVGWIMRANATPPMIAIGIGNHHLTCKIIEKNEEFSVCIPGQDLLVKTDYAGIVSGKEIDKSTIFNVFYKNLENAPLIEEAIVNLELRLVQKVELPTNNLYIGEIFNAWAKEEFYTGKYPDYEKGNAYFLTMPDNRYWGFGEYLGKAWNIGKEYK